jgi:hypothetical protein
MSFDDYESKFGGFTADSDLALAAMGFFQNGGSELWVVRTMHYTDPADPSTFTATRAEANIGTETVAILSVRAREFGAFGNRLQVELRAPSSGQVGAFDCLILDDGAHRESFLNVTLAPNEPRYVERVVNDHLLGSALVSVRDLRPGSAPELPHDVITLSGGSDGLVDLSDADFVGSQAGKTGLYAFDSVQSLALLTIPGRATPAVHTAMLNYCETARDGMVFAILDPPANATATEMVTYVANTAALEEASEYGAIYWPRIKVLNPKKSAFGPYDQIVVAPSGHIAGVFARTDVARSGGVYDPPAGIEAGRLFEVLGFETNEVLEEAKRDVVYPHRINPLTTEPGYPRYIDGCRTLRSSGNFPYVAERRGVIFIERSLKAALQFARHKNNTEALRAQVHRTIKAFLMTQMKNDAFRSNEPGKAFFVDVSDAINPPSEVFAGRLNARVGLATNKPAEFVILKITQDTRALDAELAQSKG